MASIFTKSKGGEKTKSGISILLFLRERIIEYCLPSSDGALATQTVKEFVMNVAARSPAPGGGSVSALLGALV